MNTDNKNPPTNYRLKAGDTVVLREPARVDQYIVPDGAFSRGTWDFMYVLRGVRGVVVNPRTPCITSKDGKTCYFANVDIPFEGKTYRVRVFHNTIRRVSNKAVVV